MRQTGEKLFFHESFIYFRIRFIHVFVELLSSGRVLILQPSLHKINGVDNGDTHNASNAPIEDFAKEPVNEIRILMV